MTPPTRLFSVAQANATLPLVSRIVEDLLVLHPQWREAVSAFDLAQLDSNASAESVVAREARERANRLAQDIAACLAELEQIGCSFRGFDLGLVDFPAERNGEVVSLCWQSGEPRVEHWHDTEAGFAGRQPIDSEFHESGSR